MDAAANLLWPFIVFAGFGLLIDLLIGRAGRDRVKKFVTRWWKRFNDIHWHNFGREEGLFTGQLIGKWFGRRLWSWRRIVSALLVLFMFILIGLIRLIFQSRADTQWCFYCGFSDVQHWKDLKDWVVWYGLFFQIVSAVIIFVIGFSLSVSFTKLIALVMGRLCGNGTIRNLTIFSASMIINYAFLCIWSPVMTAIRYFGTTLVVTQADIIDDILTGDISLAQAYSIYLPIIRDELQSIHQMINFYPTTVTAVFTTRSIPVDLFAFFSASSVPSVCRLLISIVFVGSFLIGKRSMRPVSFLWERIIESDQPVFTLIFGLLGALAAAVEEVAKHFGGSPHPPAG